MIDVTFLISTYNRGTVLLGTLARLGTCGLPAARYETIVVDNASTDGTADLITHWFRDAKLIRLDENRGPCAKNEGLRVARGKYVVFLDDDSYPAPGSIARMIAHFERDERLGAATFTVTLPSGQRECSAYPNVFIGCGTGFRKAALDEVGGLPTDFFMQAEEYDLSLRLMGAGWHVHTFDDLQVTHLKTQAARYPERVAMLDVRNNLVLAARHFPLRWAIAYGFDWTRRYRWIAKVNGRRWAHWRGVMAALGRIATGVGRRPVSAETFEQFSRMRETETRLREATKGNAKLRVLFIDLGKNSLAYLRAANRLGLNVVAIADDKLGGHGFSYYGVPVVTDAVAGTLAYDVAIVSNLSPVHAEARAAEWRKRAVRPVIDLFEATADTLHGEAKRAA